jgi:small-conductance mechanosensitive channel
MPKPSLPIDWDVVKGLYLQGVPVSTLSQRFGINANTLRAKASKKGWNAIVGTERERKEQITEKSTAIARDIWSERRETIRERIHLIGDRMTKVASELPDDQILTKADKIKIATEIAGKSVGLDREEDRNQVNIAILGAIGSSPSTYDDVVQCEVSSQSVTMLPATE